MSLENGTKLGRYEIRSKIGEGGMGEVYRAQDTKLDRKVALKILPADVASSRERMERFGREAKSAAALSHPNIAQIFEIGEAEGAHYIALEFIDGVTLREKIHRERTELRKLLRYLQHTAEGLAKAHAAGIVHRDLKPDNIMITRDGHAKILDFGLAKLIEPQERVPASSGGSSEIATAILPQHSAPGTVLGTVGYMSPEQAQGKVDEIDQRSDIFSFGCILFEAVTGQRAFAGRDAIDTLNKIIREPSPPISDFRPNAPNHLQRIVRRCLAKDREDRYQTIKDVAIELRELRRELEGAGVDTTVPPARSRTTSENGGKQTAPTTVLPEQSSATTGTLAKPKRRKTLIAIVVIATAVIAVTSAVVVNSYLSRKDRPIESIAVMPFVNESDNADVEYLSDGMTETLIRTLSQLPNLNVKARSSVFRYKGKPSDARTVGRELNVQAILNGQVVQRGDQLTLNLELIDAQTENVIWADQYNRKQTDLLNLQAEIARDVSSKLRLKLSGADQQKLAKNYTNDPEAYRLYLQGRFYWNKRAGREFQRSEGYFRQAVERDPRFALGYVGLADFYGDRERDKAKENVNRALALDPDLAEAHGTLGYQYMLDYDFAAAERHMKRALELDPKNLELYRWNGQRLMMLGKFEEAFDSFRRALEIDPNSTPVHFIYGACLVASGQLDKGIEYLENAAKADPGFVWNHSQLSFAYRFKNNYAGAAEERAIAQELLGETENARLTRESFARGGRAGFLREMIRQGVNPDGVTGGMRTASAHALLGENEKALELLERLAKGGEFWLFQIKYDPAYDALRGDPRFQALVKKFDPPR